MAKPQPRRARQREQRRQAIETAALDLYLEKGVERTTVDQISARADVSKGTFFNYFEDKYGVLADRLRRLAAEFVSFFADSSMKSPLEQLEAFFVKAETLFRRESPGILALYSEVLARPYLISIDKEVEEQVNGHYSRIIQEGQAAGLLRAEADPRVAAAIIGDIWSSTLRNWMADAGAFALAGAISGKLKQLFAGLNAPT